MQVERDGTVLVSQHSGTEACGPADVRRSGGGPVVYVAHDSHAGYLRPGTRDRTFPDPNDEAPGDGRVVRPAVRLVTADGPAWMRWPGRWGRTRAGGVPGESDSPRGPRYQGARWDDPAAVLRDAAACRTGAGRANRAETIVAGAGLAVLSLAVVRFARRRRRALPDA